MTDCSGTAVNFPSFGSRRIEVDFTGGSVTSDGGVMLLREADRLLGLMKSLSEVLTDPRSPSYRTHSLATLLGQRIFGLALGYEDGNDHGTLRGDPAFQAALGKAEPLGSPSTLCRMEQWCDRAAAVAIHGVLVEKFLDSFSTPPEELVLDLDATDVPVHGNQEGRFFHGYYDHHCFLPLYVFCGHEPLVAYLRPSNRDGAAHAAAVVKLLVGTIRARFPEVRIIIRADSGFCRQRLIRWCERAGVDYVIGLAKNKRLLLAAAPAMAEAKELSEATGEAARVFTTFSYGAESWDTERRIIGKAEHLPMGANPRFLVTSLPDDPKWLYEKLYCARGDMENRIKETQLQLFADRTSCHKWWGNQFRLLLSTCAYLLIHTIRKLGLSGTELERAEVGTIRLKLLKIGAVIIRNTRRVSFKLSTSYPFQDLFRLVASRLLAPT